ncbi:MAG: DinB family protein [Ignavibacteria bacterium]|nr:DinB family protein [Ignavibacteria bacterium]MDP3832274.1 DinB family protein [Ignavibacteriaceae bacterium]
MDKIFFKPETSEYDKFYQTYMDYLPDELDIIGQLLTQKQIVLDFISSLTEDSALFSYAEGKWTIKEVLGHMIDTERVFSYRVLAISRGEQQKLPGFEQDDYVINGKFNLRPLKSLSNEYESLRNSNIALFRSFETGQLSRKGIASEKSVSVNALLFMLTGHELHHIKILREKYKSFNNKTL